MKGFWGARACNDNHAKDLFMAFPRCNCSRKTLKRLLYQQSNISCFFPQFWKNLECVGKPRTFKAILKYWPAPYLCNSSSIIVAEASVLQCLDSYRFPFLFHLCFFLHRMYSALLSVVSWKRIIIAWFSVIISAACTNTTVVFVSRDQATILFDHNLSLKTVYQG